MFEKLAYAGRTTQFTLPLYQHDGATAAVLADTDEVRVKVSRGSTIVLDLDSIDGTSDGSAVTINALNPASITVRLAQGDTDGLDGVYDVEVSVIDYADSEYSNPDHPIEVSGIGVLHVVGNRPGGDIGAV